ncbi:MAG: M20/M25/M40 family metallo-hydrolase [Deltaproteobacteria bacterium]|nr:M20/M25/M40 family metallo-hydrolase [Deltaproteobacteria bacterium]
MKHEAVELLSRYIQFDTTVPPGNERLAVDFFADLFDREGVSFKTYEADAGRASIRAVLPGSGRKDPIILLNHIDVVPADRSAWHFDPFGGEVRDGYILGRGTLDMKGQGIMELLAFLAMKRGGMSLNRDLIFLATADEEALGFKGVKYLLDNYPEDFRADFVLNEGGIGVSGIVPGGPLMMIATAEKGPCWLRLTRSGPSGHGSMPHGENALERMVQALHRLFSKEMPLTVTPIVAEYLMNLGIGHRVPKEASADERNEGIIGALKESGYIAVPQVAAMVKNTISLNSLHAGVKTNVIPGQAEADLDIRLLPGQRIEDMVQYVRDVLADDAIAVHQMLGNEANESPKDTEYYRIIDTVLLEHFPGAVVSPSLLVGTSDSRFFREKGILSYGITPIVISLQEVGLIHGVDERISVDNLLKGTEVTTDLVRRLCSY